MNAALSRLMKKRSPRVVAIGKNPRASSVGLINSQTVIANSAIPMAANSSARIDVKKTLSLRRINIRVQPEQIGRVRYI